MIGDKSFSILVICLRTTDYISSIEYMAKFKKSLSFKTFLATDLTDLQPQYDGYFMDKNQSFLFFMRLIKEKHNELKENTGFLFNVLVNENKSEKEVACQKVLNSAEAISNILAKPDRPIWLTETIKYCAWYTQNIGRDDCNNILFSNLYPYYNEIINYKWSIGENDVSTNYNFDEIYERFKSESQLPSLFNTLIDILEKMIESGEIDSVKAMSSINQLLSLLKQNKEGSYFSMMASWEFIGGFIKNSLWESLELIPGIAQLKKAFEKTAVEMDIQIEQIHKSIAKEMKDRYSTTVNSLVYKKAKNDAIESNEK